MRGFFSDLRYAARTLGRSPGLVLVATLSLALGMGVNTTLFSATRAILFADATVTHPNTLVRAWIGGSRSISYANLRDLRDRAIFRDLAGSQLAVFSARPDREAEKATGEVVTANYFEVLGVGAARGRTFAAAEAAPGTDPRVVVLSHGYCERRLADCSGAIGRTLPINGQPYTVIGVLPETFRSIEGFGLAPEMYVPAGRVVAGTLDKRDGFRMRVLGRLKEGRSREQTQAALASAARDLERAYPVENRGLGRGGAQLFGVSATDRLREAGGMAPAMMMTALMAAVCAMVLLIACGNVAGLLLARGASRRREIAVRLALGAGRARIIRQLLAETLLLAGLGAACAWLLSLWTPALLNTSTLALPMALPLEFRLDQGIALLPLELLLIVAAMLLCGLAPALESTRVALVPALKESAGTPGSRSSARRRRSVRLQVAASMVQLVIAILFLRALGTSVRADAGFDVDRLLNAQVTLDEPRFNQPRALAYLDDAVQRLRALGGVEAASAAATAPLSNFTNEASVEVEGHPDLREPHAKLNAVSPGYFRTMGIAMVRGRDFETGDREGAPRVAIAGERLATQLFPKGDAIGRQVRTDEGRLLEIVGVVRDSAYSSVGETPQPLLYRPLAQEWDAVGLVVHVRTSGPPSMVAPAVKRVLAGLDRDVPSTVRPMRDYVELSLSPIRAAAGILAAMGALGMLLALVGLYGLMSHTVARRAHDFGILMALGAAPETIQRDVLKDAVRLVGWGVVVGALVAVVVTRVAGTLVVTAQNIDVVGLLAPALLLLAAGVAASYFPARRATRTDPATALRCE